MLNRQNVKNVLIPLVPGEMKVTVVDDSTLQVARRGESESSISAWSSILADVRFVEQRRGVWFSDGHGDIDRFRDMIVRYVLSQPLEW